MILHQINFSLCSACKAKCVFCPLETRGKRIPTKMMPLASAQRILDEVADASRFGITGIGIGENGDCFLNPQALDVLRYVRQVLPHAATIVYTNMQHVTPDVADQIVGERLISELQFNIDSAIPERYEAMKGLSFDLTIGHIRYLLERRNAANDPMRLNCYLDPATLYVESIRSLGIEPSHGPTLPPLSADQEMLGVCALLNPYLRRPNDNVYFQQPYAWAERAQFEGTDIDYAGLCCPLMPRIRDEAFVAPDGTWYACCYDGNNENDLGNVLTEGVYAVATGAKRRTLITQLEQGRFAEIGGPCRTVNCCQGL
jgi:MoaA/NifB/PqqE/SkfB family radical SAM enzyme